MGFNYTSFSNAGSNRKFNEDAVETLEIDGGLLAVLCDGVGGDYNGELAAKIAVKTAVSFFSSFNVDDYIDRIKTTIEQTNNFLVSRANLHQTEINLATTFEILFFKDTFVYWGHIGDSRIYQLKSKKLYQVTKDHSLVQKLLDEGFINHRQANNHPQRNVIIKALGDSLNIEPDLSIIKVNEAENCRFFMCSDGITNLISNKELEELLSFEDIEEIKQNITKLARVRGALDDYSFIIVDKTK